MTEQDEALYLVDSSIYIFRAYYSIPDNFKDKAGESVNAVYGYTNFLLDLIDKGPQFISCAFDESLNTCYRNRIYPDYKANRDLPGPNLEYQLAKCQEITDLLGFHSVCLYDYEADDIIGTLQARLGQDRPAVIVTRDKDLGQLLREDDALWDFAANDFSDRGTVKEKFGVEAEQIADYLALAGDSVDNIPGAPGVGAKTAAALLQHFGDIDTLYQRIEEVPETGVRGAAKIMNSLKENEANVRMFQEITRIHCEVPMEVTLDDLRLDKPDPAAMDNFLSELNFGKRTIERIQKLQ